MRRRRLRRADAVSDAHERRERTVISKRMSGKGGMTLVELLIASAVLTLGLVSSFALLGLLVRMNHTNGRMSAAVTLAQGLVERMISDPAANWVTGSDTVAEFTRQWEVSSEGAYSSVRVSVTWDDSGGAQRGVSLYSILGEEP